MKFVFIILFLIVFSQGSLAEKRGTRKPAHFEIEIVFGDRISSFQFNDKTNELTLLRTNEAPRSIKMNAKNVQYLLTEVSKIAQQKTHDIQLCMRQNLKIQTTDAQGKPLSTLACLGSPTEEAKKATRLINTLDLLF